MGRGRIWIAALCLATLAGLALLLSLPEPTARSLTTEGSGFVEYGAVIGYVLCALVIAVLSHAGPGLRAALVAIPLLLAAREMDLDKRLFTEGLFKSSQYLKGIVPVPEVVISVLVLLGIAACAWLVLSRGGRIFLADLMRGETWALAVSTAVAVALVAKGLDGLARKLAPLGIEVSDRLGARTELIEEGLELAIPAFLILAAVSFGWRRSNPAID